MRGQTNIVLSYDKSMAELWRRGDISCKLWPQQEVIYDTIRGLPRDIQTIVLLCARQFGKSVVGCILATEDCLQNPDVVVMIVGPTIKQTREIVVPRMKMIMRECPEDLIRFIKSEDTWIFANGSELKLGGFDTRSCAQRGKTLHKIYLEEICESNPDNYDEFLREDLGPALTHSKHAQIVYLTTLPKFPDHPFCTSTVPEAQEGGAYFCFTIDDNKELSPAQYAACVKRCGGRDSIAFRREYLCQQVRDSSIILAPEFDEVRHVKQIDIPSHYRCWTSGDVGGVRDKSVFHLWLYDFERAKPHVLAERAFDHDTPSTAFIPSLFEMEKGFDVKARWVDMPGQLQVDFMVQHHYPCALPRKDELDPTINLSRVALARNEVTIDPSCKLLIQTLRSGTFNEQRTDLARSKALGHCDAFMSFCYGLRHADRSNPFPLYGGVDPRTNYVDTSPANRQMSQSAQTLKSLFVVRR